MCIRDSPNGASSARRRRHFLGAGGSSRWNFSAGARSVTTAAQTALQPAQVLVGVGSCAPQVGCALWDQHQGTTVL
eukprot:15447362-Alexandrium_andersonii.AAC.1